MNRSRWIALGVAGVLALTGIAAASHMQGDPKPTVNLSAGSSKTDTQRDEPEVPYGDDALTTATTFDLSELIPSTTTSTTRPFIGDSTVGPSTTTTTAAPSTTTSTTSPFATVKVKNNATYAVKVWVGDDSEHEQILQPGGTTQWTVTASSRHPDAGGVVSDGSFCGTKWHDEDQIIAGHSYVMTITGTDDGYRCENNALWPKINWYDETAQWGWFRGAPNDLPRSG